MGEGETESTDVVAGPERPDAEPVSAHVPLLPAVVGRLDTVHSSVTALAMRIDALGALTTSLGSAMTDRLTEYGDTVSQMTRGQVETLDEYRHGTERTVTELRRSLAASDELIRRMAARVDELVTDTTSLMEIVQVLGAAPIRTEAEPSSSATEEKLDSLSIAVAEMASRMRTAAPQAEPEEWLSGSDTTLDSLHASVQEIATEFSSAMSSVAALRNDLSSELQAGIDELRAELKAVASSRPVSKVADGAGSGAPSADASELARLSEELSTELVALRSEMAQLKRRIGVRAKSTGALDEFQLRELADRITESVRPAGLTDDDIKRIAESVRPAPLADADIERIVTAIGAHLESTFEVVPDDGPVPPPPPVDEKPASRRRR